MIQLSIPTLIFALILSSSAWGRTLPVNRTDSQVEWIGSKRFSEENHFGRVKIKQGMIRIDSHGQLQGGTIVIDMSSIENLDLSGTYKSKIEEHLKSKDFFDVDNNPEAFFKMTQAISKGLNTYEVTGNLTIRGTTHPETFLLTLDKKGRAYIATAEISIDRTKYGVSYNKEASTLKKMTTVPKDKIISNKIDLKLKLQTQTL